MRVSKVVMLLIALGIVGGGAFLIITGTVLFGIDLKGLFGKGIDAATGFGAAKTPSDAMDLFHKAIQDRNYKTAANYCTKGYADQLRRAHAGASEFGNNLDRIRNYAQNKGLVTDKLIYAFDQFDPFPKNFKPGPAPVENAGKATAKYVWEMLPYKNWNPAIAFDPEFKDMDPRMMQKILKVGFVFESNIELVKEGDEWKLNIPSNPIFETNVGYFNDRYKTYNTGLEGFIFDMTRGRYENPGAYEREVFDRLKAAK